MNKNNLAIFDLDGTLFNTNEINYYSYKTALAEQGFNLDKDYFISHCNGRHYKVFLTPILNNNELVELVHDRKKELYSSFLNKAIINNHLFNIIKFIKKDYYTAVVTTASRKNVDEILSYFEVADLFDLILTQEDVVNKKPDPEGFFKAIEHFQTLPENTVIFEDSEVGIKAAQKTGASIFIANKF